MKDNGRAAFMVYKDQRILFDAQTDENAGKLIKAVFAYICDGTELETTDGMLNMAFKVVQAALDRDMEKYEQTCARNAENQRRRWERRQKSDAEIVAEIDQEESEQEYDRIAPNTNHSIVIEPYTNDTDTNTDTKNDTDPDTDTDTKTDTESDAARVLRFVPTPPDPYTPKQLMQICQRERIPLNVYGVTGFVKAMQATNWNYAGRPIENIAAVLTLYSQQAPETYTRDLSQAVAWG